ncbi:hypothetical protein SpAn4DRAFT_2020 [Sporomusa ovata]|uniref:Uncharacterized protein n=1 Tax=Sporomusa ovata TaxID=2378 RepID=A0A0U1KUF2_9FIRM|nr:hypothetical protein SpAn4DRAFT_2020 [Sporomusa ovata]
MNLNIKEAVEKLNNKFIHSPTLYGFSLKKVQQKTAHIS